MPTTLRVPHLKRSLRAAALLLLTAFMLLTGVQPAQAAEVITYFHHDAAGTPQLATDAAGNVLWKETYRPYGERIRREAGATSNNSLWFTGKPQDANSGLVYMGARYYEPVLGRFTGIDPAGVDEVNLHSFNRYAYGNNNPYKYVDPDGRNPVLIWMGVGAVTGGLTAGAMNAAVQYMATGQVDWGVYGVSGAAAEGAQMGMVFGPAGFAAGARADVGTAVKGVANPVPSTMARVIPNGTPATTLGRPGAGDVFVTGASEIAGMNSKQIAQRLAIPESSTGFKVIEFATPSSGVASPVFRNDPGFVGRGRTEGGAREFVIPNGPIPADARIRTVP